MNNKNDELVTTCEKINRIHEQACIIISDALAKLSHHHVVVDIANPMVKRVKDIASPLVLEGEVGIGVGVCLPVGGEVKGAALLLLSQETAFKLSDLLIKKDIGTTIDLDEIDKSALKELGNIICGSYLTTLSNQVRMEMIEYIPQLNCGPLKTILKETTTEFAQKTEKALAMEIDFIFPVLASRNFSFRSYFLVLFETMQLETILDSLEKVGVKAAK